MKKSESERLIGNAALFRTGFFSNDFLSSYLPMFIELFSSIEEEEIDIYLVKERFQAMFGFVIPSEPLQEHLKICIKKTYLKKSLKNAGHLVINRNLVETEFQKYDIDKASWKFDQVINSLIEYAKSGLNIDLNQSDAEGALILFAKENSTDTLTNTLDKFSQNYSDKQLLYIVAKFVLFAREDKTDLYGYIQEICLSNIISTSLTVNGVDGVELKNMFKDLVIYLDSPLILRLFNLQKVEMFESTMLLIQRLHDIGAKFKVFSRTYNEVLNILRDARNRIKSGELLDSYNEIVRRFICENKSDIDIELIISNIDDLYRKHGIIIDDRNYFSEEFHRYQVDESIIRDQIIKVYNEGNNRFNYNERGHTLDHDVSAISNILKLWRGKEFRNYSQAKFIFLTNNKGITYAIRRLGDLINKSHEHSVYPCITDVYIGTEIWLNSPIEQLANYNEKKLIADCLGFLDTSSKLVNRIAFELKKMKEKGSVSLEYYDLLRSGRYSFDYITNRTLNDETAFYEGLIEEYQRDFEYRLKLPLLEEIASLSDESQNKSDIIESMKQEDSIKASKVQKLRADSIKRYERNRMTLIAILFIGGLILNVLLFMLQVLDNLALAFAVLMLIIIISMLKYILEIKSLSSKLFEWYFSFIYAKHIMNEQNMIE